LTTGKQNRETEEDMWTITKYSDKYAVVNGNMDLIASFTSKKEAEAFINKLNPA